MVLGAVSPYIWGAEKYKTYTNEKLHVSMKLPSSAKKNMEKLSENAREFPVNFYLTARIVYGDIYEDTLSEKKLSKDELLREEVYIESQYTKDTWNDKKYITKYFKDILGDAKSEYSFEVSKSKLSGIPAWKCYYKGKSAKSAGYYYLTVTNGGLYVLQLDCYLKSLSNYKGTINKIKDSYTITNLVVPDAAEIAAKKKSLAAKKNKEAEVKEEQKETPKEETSPAEIQTEKEGESVFGYFFGGGILILIVGGIVIYALRQKKYKNMKKKRKELRVKRKNNDKIE
ncbi:hypothetical protein [Anaerofustis stercorihominis]|nr:hypothetical protein [Anaerofustis stercorihominis]